VIPWQPIGIDYLSQVASEVFERLCRAALAVQLLKGERPAGRLVAGMFPHHPIQPSANATGKPEIIWVDSQNIPAVGLFWRVSRRVSVPASKAQMLKDLDVARTFCG